MLSQRIWVDHGRTTGWVAIFAADGLRQTPQPGRIQNPKQVSERSPKLCEVPKWREMERSQVSWGDMKMIEKLLGKSKHLNGIYLVIRIESSR